MIKNDFVLGLLAKHKGLLKNVFGSFTNDLIYDQDREFYKDLLVNVYGYDRADVEINFPSRINEKTMNDTLKTLFTYYGETQQDKLNK